MSFIKNPKLIMLIGIPGSGKSRFLLGSGITVAKQLILKEKIGGIVLSPDNLRREMTSNVSNQQVNTEVWLKIKEKTKKYLTMGNNVIIDATNVNTKYRREFLVGLPKCILQAKIFKVKPEIACARIKRDLKKGKDRSNVPDEVVYRMYGEFLYTLTVLKSEGFKIIK